MTEVVQVGGNHYDSQFQHWDWVTEIKMGYLAGCATKYVSRWWKKGGVQDVQKARTYVEKMLEKFSQLQNDCLELPGHIVDHYTKKFCRVNNLPAVETTICTLMTIWSTREDLQGVLDLMDELLKLAEARLAGATGPTGQAPATTLAGQGGKAPPALPHSPAQGIAGQAPAAASPTAHQAFKSLEQLQKQEAAFGLCPCGCGRPRAKNMHYATPECRARGLTGLEHPFGYDEE